MKINGAGPTEGQGTTQAKIQSDGTARVTGPGAASVKYDILTALLVTATCDPSSSTSRLALRLSLVITSRFNWSSGLFNVGQRELARMWGVTERTTKRELALMRNLGWISVDRSAARGRVARYRINFPTLLRATTSNWAAVGPDFTERMTGAPEPVQTNVVPLHTNQETIPAEDGTHWPAVAADLQAQDPTVYAAWYANLMLVEVENDSWVFAAPSQFAATYIKTHLYGRLFAAVATHDRTARRIQFVTL